MTTILGGRYRLGEVLGTGGMGQVFAATDERLDRDVAVKVLRDDLARDPEARARFRREARAAARLVHPNVVTVYDTAHDDDEAFLVMERGTGATLDDEMRAGPLAPARLHAVARDVASALAAAHEAGIVHRDVKPANVIVGFDGRLKVADFGIAKALDAAETATVGPGYATVAYAAPERLRGEPATPTSDVWSLGVLLYEAATGGRPLAGAHRPLAELRPDLDLTFVTAVEQMLRPDPALRPADGHQVVHLLDADASGTAATQALSAPPDARTATHTLPLAAVAALPVATAAGGPPALPARPSPKRPAPARGRRSTRFLVPAAALAAAALVVALLAAGTGGGADPARAPATTASPSTTAVTTAVTTTTATTVPRPVATTAPVKVGGPPAEKPGKGNGKGNGKGD